MLRTELTAQEVFINHRVSYAKRGILVALLSGLTWGIQSVLYGMIMGQSPFASPEYGAYAVLVAATVAAGMHDLFAGGWITIYNLITGRGVEYLRTIKTKPGILLLIGTILGGPINMISQALAVNYAGATYNLALLATFPVFGAFLGRIVLKEKLVARSWLGIFLVVTGAILVTYVPPAGNFYPHFYLGIAFALFAAIVCAVDAVIATYGMDMIDPEVVVGFKLVWSGLLSLGLVIPIFSIIGATGLLGYKILGNAFSIGTPALVLVVAALFGGSSWFFNYKSFNMTGAGRGTALNATFALWGVVFAAIFSAFGLYSFAMTKIAIVGAVVIFAGTILIIANPKELLELRN